MGLHKLSSWYSRVTVDQEEFDFGKMDSSEKGSHEFLFTNRGEQTITLRAAARNVRLHRKRNQG